MTTRQIHDQGEWLIEFFLAKLTEEDIVESELPAFRKTKSGTTFEQMNLKIIDFHMAIPIAKIYTTKNEEINTIDSQHRVDLIVLFELEDETKAWLPIEIKLGKNFNTRKVYPNQEDFSKKIGSVSNILSHNAKKKDQTFNYVNFLLPPRIQLKHKAEVINSWGLLLKNVCPEKGPLKTIKNSPTYEKQNIEYIFCLGCIYNKIKEKHKENIIENQIKELILGDDKESLARDLLSICKFHPTKHI